MAHDKGSRRAFLKHTAAASVGSTLAWDAASYANIVGANDRIGIGLIGFGERMEEALLPALLKHTATQNCEVTALSDLWDLRREAGGAALRKLTGKAVTLARNNEELYENKNVQAVIIATADHQHAPHGVEAVRAGRDAYIEKPLANSLADARAILAAVRETKCIVQIGTQRRSDAPSIRAKEYLQAGEFGALTLAQLTTNANQPRRWRRPQLVAKLRPEDTDWKRFVMGRTNDEWDPRKYVEFRLYWPYSSGIPCQWMVHQLDLLHFITGLPRPRSVVAQGGIYSWRDGRVNPDTLTAVFDYGPLNDPTRGFQAIFASRMHNSSGGIRDLYYSINGTLDVTTAQVSPEGGLIERYAKNGYQPTKLTAKTLTGGQAEEAVSAHLRNWLECVRTRRAPVADIEAGYHHSVSLCMTIAALHSGKRATFDEARQEIVLN